MEGEAVKERIIMTEERERNKFTKFFDRKQESPSSSTTCSAGVRNNADVLKECQPGLDVLNEHPPTIMGKQKKHTEGNRKSSKEAYQLSYFIEFVVYVTFS